MVPILTLIPTHTGSALQGRSGAGGMSFAIINECFLSICGGLESNPMTSRFHALLLRVQTLVQRIMFLPVSFTIALATVIFGKFLTCQRDLYDD